MRQHRSTFGVEQHLSISSLPTIDISSGELSPSTPDSPETPVDNVHRRNEFDECAKQDDVLLGARIIVCGSDDDLPSYYVASRPNSRPRSSAPSVQIVPIDIDPSEAHHEAPALDEPHAI